MRLVLVVCSVLVVSGRFGCLVFVVGVPLFAARCVLAVGRCLLCVISCLVFVV